MMKSRKLLLLLVPILGLVIFGCEQKPAAEKSHMAHFEVEGNFEEVRDYVKFAISDRGIKINNISHIGNMLSRTAGAVGASKTVFKDAEAIEFCSATISRAMMEADPNNIVFCPYIISVYTLPGEENKVHIAYRHPQLVGTEESKKALMAVEDLLSGIVKSATE